MTVNIIIPCYNQAQYLSEAIQSVVEQEYEDWTLDIVIDASPDDSLRIAQEWSYKFPDKISVHNLTENVGLTHARNYAIQLRHDEFLLFLDSDDMINWNYLTHTVEVLNENPDIGIAYTDTEHIGDSDGHWNHPEYSFFNLLKGNFLSYCSLIRRSMFDAVGGLDLSNRGGMEDYTLWVDMGAKGFYGKHIPIKLFYYRVHKDSMTQDENWIKLQNIYMSHIILRHPELYDTSWITKATSIIALVPPDFMMMDRKDRVKYLSNFS